MSDGLPVETRGLVKRYGEIVAVHDVDLSQVVAVDGVDLTLHTGDIYGFLGPNGAGNTTAMDVDLGGGTRRDATAASATSPTPAEGAQRC